MTLTKEFKSSSIQFIIGLLFIIIFIINTIISYLNNSEGFFFKLIILFSSFVIVYLPFIKFQKMLINTKKEKSNSLLFLKQRIKILAFLMMFLVIICFSLYHVLLIKEGFNKGTNLYFQIAAIAFGLWSSGIYIINYVAINKQSTKT